MDYETWVGRERRIRTRILAGSPVIRESGIYRVCQDCGEVCLCHEEGCPNCGGCEILEEKLQDVEQQVLGGARIRCRFRFEHLG